MTTPQSIFELFQTIGFRDYRNADGELVVELPVAPHVLNTNGGLQGGLLATLVDIAAGKLALEVISPETSVVTSDLSVRYLRPIKTGAARATARIVYSGKRSLVMQVDIVGLPDEELTAIATVSFATVRRAGKEDS
ncbi:MAG: hypothetical protein QOJ80_2703 [Mycobacterium sp.]|jgi:uncharacterized protein (TIGR00369 family)|nr:hypothetical protein [Mycobacterium sp.]